MPAQPILYSFRRCPYAMRARFALDASGLTCELREVVLRDKPPELLAASAKATVPVLVVPDGRVLDESMDIMHWALRQNDPGQWLVPQRGSLAAMVQLIAQFDGDFKHHLDRYKYPNHHAGEDATEDHRSACAAHLLALEQSLGNADFLFGTHASLADMAIAPFVRQFAHTDDAWFGSQPWPRLAGWLAVWEASALFDRVMHKYAPWHPGQATTIFPAQDAGPR